MKRATTPTIPFGRNFFQGGFGMVAQIPKGVYTMKAKRAIIKHNASAYRKATKGQVPFFL